MVRVYLRSDTTGQHLGLASPEKSAEALATHEHVGDIPPAVRTLLRALGGWGRDWRMASYLLFEAPYCGELIRLGYEDGKRQRDRLLEFLGSAT